MLTTDDIQNEVDSLVRDIFEVARVPITEGSTMKPEDVINKYQLLIDRINDMKGITLTPQELDVKINSKQKEYEDTKLNIIELETNLKALFHQLNLKTRQSIAEINKESKI